MKLFRMFPATIATFAVLFGSIFPAMAVQQLENPDDVDGICQYSDPQLKDVSKNKTESDEQPDLSRDYQTQRRAMAQKVMEVTVSAEQLALIGYDHITGILSISGFRDYPLFSGRHFLRFKEGCALHFELDETTARDWSARVRMGGAGLKIGFLLNAHDNYEQAFCEAQQSKPAKIQTAEGDDDNDAGTAHSESSPHVVLSDLLYATLIDSNGKELSTYHSELGHRVYLRRASRMDGQKTSPVPRVEVTSLVWTGGNLSAESSVSKTTAKEKHVNKDSDTKQVDQTTDKMDAWWRSAIEAAVYPCYQRGLARNGRLQGAFVLRMPAAGRSDVGAEILLDTLQMDNVSSCILERVRAIRTPATDTRRWTSLKATMLFMLD